jgi:Arc/MetJ-type ribon-helix-helix transcriptional regulator
LYGLFPEQAETAFCKKLLGGKFMPYVKKQFSLSSEQNEFIDSIVRKKSFKDKSEAVRYGIELVKQQFQDMELREMAKDYSNDHDFVQIGKRGVKLQGL